MCLELCSWANWRQILEPCYRTWQLRNPSWSWSWRVQHAVQGQVPSSGAGGMARNPRKQGRKQCCHLPRASLTGQEGSKDRDWARLLWKMPWANAAWALAWGMAGAENRERKGRWHQGRMMAPEQTRPAPVPAGDAPNHHCICVQLGCSRTKMGIPQR